MERLHLRDGACSFTRREYPVSLLFSFILAPFAAFLARTPAFAVRGYAWMLGALLIVHFAVYSLMSVPPYHWYYVPTAVCATLLGALGLATLNQRAQTPRQRWLRTALAVVPALLPLGLLLHLAREHTVMPTQVPMHTNWATAAQYREIGLWLRENTPPTAEIALVGEIGTVAYYAQRRITDVYNTRTYLLNDIEKRPARSTLQNVLLSDELRVLPRDAKPHETHYLIMQPSLANFARPPLQEWSIRSQWVPAGRVGLFHTPSMTDAPGVRPPASPR